MKRAATIAVVLTLIATALFAHGADSHTLLGTVKALDGDRVTVTKTDGKEVTVALTQETIYLRGSEKASRTELVGGTRVAIKLTHDNAKAVSVKLPPRK